MTRVATYAFLDLETTGLPKQELNKTRITELSLVVVRRRHILDTRPGAAPRVQEKLTLCFNPGRLIHPESSDVSGLDNFLLEHHTPFNINVFNTINSFLQCLEKPVCLVAQNGHSYDFPILKNHFEKLGVSLSDDILCADSLYAMYDIFGLGWGQKNTNMENGDHKSNGSSSGQEHHNQTTDKIVEDQVEAPRSSKQIRNNSNTYSVQHITQELLKDFEENDDLSNQRLIQQQNERTPAQKRIPIPKPIKAIDKVKRKLFFIKTGKEELEKKTGKKPSVSYKMKDLYERELLRPAIEAHRAENDCIMSMEVAVSVAKKFVDWIDNAENQCLLILTGVLWGCTNPFIRQGTKGLRDVTATTVGGQVWAEVTFLLGNWKYVLPWLVNQAGSLSYLAAVQRAPLSVAVPVANSLAFVFTAVTGAGIGAEEPLDARSIMGIVLIMAGTALCCFDTPIEDTGEKII